MGKPFLGWSELFPPPLPSHIITNRIGGPSLLRVPPRVPLEVFPELCPGFRDTPVELSGFRLIPHCRLSPLKTPGGILALPSSALALHSPYSARAVFGAPQSSPPAAEQGQGFPGRCRDLPSVPKSWRDLKACRGKHKAEGQVLKPSVTWAEMSPQPGLCPEPHAGTGQARDRRVFLPRRGLALTIAPFWGHAPGHPH